MRKRRGLTVIELLAAVLILGVMMGIATSIFLSAQADARKKQCRMYMHSIAVMADEWRYKHITGATRPFPTTLTQLADVGPVPICPNGGTYSLREVTTRSIVRLNVTCTVAAHGTYVFGKGTNE